MFDNCVGEQVDEFKIVQGLILNIAFQGNLF